MLSVFWIPSAPSVRWMNNSTFEEQLAAHGQLVYTNVGNSMMPLIRHHRDLLIIRPRPAGRLRKYDIALYRRGDKYILHRVLQVKKDSYTMCGDHQYRREFGVREEQILGMLTGIKRDGADVPLHGFRYGCYVRLWCWFFPIRAGILCARAHLRRRRSS